MKSESFQKFRNGARVKKLASPLHSMLGFTTHRYPLWNSIDQRWSRGHKARGQGQGQGHKKSPRPRTAFPRTEPLEAKHRNARGQGPRTQAQAFSKKKKVFKNFFQAISNLLAYPEFLIGEVLNYKSHEMTSSKFVQRGNFCETKIS